VVEVVLEVENFLSPLTIDLEGEVLEVVEVVLEVENFLSALAIALDLEGEVAEVGLSPLANCSNISFALACLLGVVGVPLLEEEKELLLPWILALLIGILLSDGEEVDVEEDCGDWVGD